MAQVETQSIPFDVSEGSTFSCLDCGKETVLSDGCGSEQDESGEVKGFICVPCCEKFEASQTAVAVEPKPQFVNNSWSENFIRFITMNFKRGLNRGVVDAYLRRNKYPVTSRDSWDSLREAYKALCLGRAA
jgi:hypothetical protein